MALFQEGLMPYFVEFKWLKSQKGIYPVIVMGLEGGRNE
jgi:hypothetical protein